MRRPLNAAMLLAFLVVFFVPRESSAAEEVDPEPASSPTVWDLGVLEPGKVYPTTITAANVSCKGKQTFEIQISDADWLKIEGPAVLRNIKQGKQKVTQALVDVTDLAPGAYRGVVTINCTTCPGPPKCTQNVSTLDVRLVVEESGAFHLTRSESGFTADFAWRDWNLRAELRTQGDVETLTMSEGIKGRLLEVTVPKASSSFSMVDEREMAGRLTLGEGFLASDLENQFGMLALVGQAAPRIADELDGEDQTVLGQTIRSLPGLLGLRMESERMDTVDTIFLVGPNDGRCHGACGIKCNWCSCSARWCVCWVTLFCLAHDSCCGAGREFLDCFPCEWHNWIF